MLILCILYCIFFWVVPGYIDEFIHVSSILDFVIDDYLEINDPEMKAFLRVFFWIVIMFSWLVFVVELFELIWPGFFDNLRNE